MLKKLSVDNYILIDKLELTLSPSLNTITGETGAGKSILLGALGLLLGNRCDSSVIRNNERNCIIEGIFDIENYELETFFSDNDLEYDPHTVVRRVISSTGKSRAYINDLPVQLITLKEFGSYLIDIHSQHQNLLLGQDNFRINTLDSVAGNKENVVKYSEIYHSIRNIQTQLENKKEEAEVTKKDQEWIQYQLTELDEAKLSEGEQEELENLQGELSHSEVIKETFLNSISLLEDDESGIMAKLKFMESGFVHLSGYYNRGKEFADRLRSVIVELKDIGSELSSEENRIESDPARLEIVNNRLNTIFSLQQKHKVSSVKELIEIQTKYQERLSLITEDGQEIIELERKISQITVEAFSLAEKISEERKKAAHKMSRYIEKQLKELGMADCKFIVDITTSENLKSTGIDNIRFLFSSNKNTEPAPLEKIASGGEISRVMLSLKSLIAKTAKLPTIIFDEIDTGVSGKIADAMGNIIQSLSSGMQVINITHLPQVACKGETHFYVSKDNKQTIVNTQIRLLSEQERIGEIAKMLSGSKITEAAINQARFLLGIS